MFIFVRKYKVHSLLLTWEGAQFETESDKNIKYYVMMISESLMSDIEVVVMSIITKLLSEERRGGVRHRLRVVSKVNQYTYLLIITLCLHLSLRY